MFPNSKFLLFAGAFSIITGAASAADLESYPVSSYEPRGFQYEEPPAFQWSGAYMGGHGGLVSPKLDPFSSGKAFSGGAQAGYNFQAGPGVFGVELEGTWLGSAEMSVHKGRIEERFRGAAKAKAGLSFDRTLVYGTAGLTMTKFEGAGDVSTNDSWKQGYLFGGGIERGFGGGLSAKLEYNRVITNDVTTSVGGIRSKSDINDNVFKAGINYRF